MGTIGLGPLSSTSKYEPVVIIDSRCVQGKNNSPHGTCCCQYPEVKCDRNGEKLGKVMVGYTSRISHEALHFVSVVGCSARGEVSGLTTSERLPGLTFYNGYGKLR